VKIVGWLEKFEGRYQVRNLTGQLLAEVDVNEVNDTNDTPDQFASQALGQRVKTGHHEWPFGAVAAACLGED
jgi:hypothetical protein